MKVKVETSQLYRSSDWRLYAAFVCYAIFTVVLVALCYGSISGLFSIATIYPLCALILLICFQVSERPRSSALAFCIVFVGVLAVAYAVLCIAAEASASV